MFETVSTALLAAAILTAANGPVQALNARTWISGKGADQAGCGPIASPCRTLQYAHDQTSASGEIDVLDPAGYGAIAITKSISIVNEGVGVAGVLAQAGGNAITISIGSNDTVVLRGLVIEGAGVGANGVVFNAGGNLQISNCFIQGFAGSDEQHGNGILIQHTIGIPNIVITNTTVSNNGWTGVLFRPTIGGTGNITIEHLITTGNAYGLTSDATNSAYGIYRPRLTIRNSVAANNSQIGYNLYGKSAAQLFASMASSSATNNGTGLYISSSSVFLDMSTCNLSYNEVIDMTGSGQPTVFSFGNNAIRSYTVVQKFAAAPF